MKELAAERAAGRAPSCNLPGKSPGFLFESNESDLGFFTRDKAIGVPTVMGPVQLRSAPLGKPAEMETPMPNRPVAAPVSNPAAPFSSCIVVEVLIM